MKSKGMFAAIAFIGFYITVYVVFIAENHLLRITETEQRYNAEFYTPEVSFPAEERGTRWFNAMFVDSGVMQHTFEPFIPTEEEVARSRGMEDLGQPLFHWFEGRIRAWWTLVWSTFTRLSVTLLWAPFAPFLVLPFFLDGWVLREIRKHGFDYSSAIIQRYSLRAVILIPAAFIALITLPLPMHPLATPLFLIGFGMAGQRAINHFMKRI